MLEFLSPRIAACLLRLNLNRLYELRLRADKPLCVNYGGAFVFLGEVGVCSAAHAVKPTLHEVEETLLAACEHSVYSVENQLKEGFVTAACGERLGVAGTFVYERGSVQAIREITSLCIRVPHDILGCADRVYKQCFREGLCSLIVLGPPGDGKTTILRDLTRIVSQKTSCNILVSDERGELSAGELGATTDVIRFADKSTAFTSAIRALRPDVIVTDELLPEDYHAVRRATESGIRVFASAHLMRYEDVPQKLFDRYVLLGGLGEIREIVGREGEHVA